MSVLDLLDRPIAYHRVFAKLTGSVKAAVLLSQAIYWQKRAKQADGYWWKTQEEWEEETGLSRYELDTARRDAAKYLKTVRKGVPATLFWKVDEEALEADLLQIVENQQTRLLESSKQVRGKTANINKESETTQRLHNGASAVPASLDWKIGHDEPVSEEDLKTEKQRARQDIANLIATGTGLHAQAVYDIALAFMNARDLTFTKSKVKGQRKQALNLIEQGVTADHVKQAVATLMGLNYTCVDLFQVEKTAVDLANKNSPAPQKIEYVRADPDKPKNTPPDWIFEKQRELHAKLGKVVGND